MGQQRDYGKSDKKIILFSLISFLISPFGKVKKPFHKFLENGHIQAIDDVLASALIQHQSRGLQDIQVMADGRLGDIEAAGDLPGSQISLGQQLQNPPPGGMPDRALKRHLT